MFRGAVYLRNRKINCKQDAVQIFFLMNLLVICRFAFHPFSEVDGQIQPQIFDIASLKKVVLTGFLISLCIEVIQRPFAVRASDVDDLILNTLGCMLGYGILTLSE